MKVAIDKDTIGKIKDFTEFEYIYIFDNEPLEYIRQLGLHCQRKDFADEVDINLTKYNVKCFKKANIEDADWYKLPERKDYKYAIIIPNCNNDHGNYNGKTYLQNCIESVLNQTYKNFELIIVDDMSTDNSVKTIYDYMYKEEYIDKIHLIKNKRKRYNGGSRNVGIEYALDYLDFDYFMFLDSDDWWKDNTVLEYINRRLYDHEFAIFGGEILFSNGHGYSHANKFDNYKDVFKCEGKVWCTAWSKVVRKDKIVYFCEDTLMEDRVWSYKQADNIDFDKVLHIDKICYVWNRMNNSNSVSEVKSDIWYASAWCHIGHQKQLLATLKHQEMKSFLEDKINACIQKISRGVYEQF